MINPADVNAVVERIVIAVLKDAPSGAYIDEDQRQAIRKAVLENSHHIPEWATLPKVPNK